jgi:RNA-directed DNA polymerase
MTSLEINIEEWKRLPWKSFEVNLFRLQHRLYKAAQEKDEAKCLKLQSLILGSTCSRFMAVRQVVQLNMGKKTYGVDGISNMNHTARFKLAEELKQLKGWKHQKLRRVLIPKTSGELRPLGIPTLRDRAMQCLLKYALEPVYEAYASKGSWGFRPGRSTHDVQKVIFINLKSDANGHKKRILELDIEKCLDKINHEKLLSLINFPQTGKDIIKSALEAGVLNERMKTLVGTPQGGVISPLLCNIALHGIEDIHNEWHKKSWLQKGIRYADDMIFFLKTGEDENELLTKTNDFLTERGLNLKESKSQCVASTQGFDFLGWNFKVKDNNEKFVCTPSKKSKKNIVDKIQRCIKDSRKPLIDRLRKIQVIYRGWRNYHQYCDMSKEYPWTLSRWTYKYVKSNTKMPSEEIIDWVKKIYNGYSYQLNSFVNVKAEKSPFDNDWIYWSKRNNKRYQGLREKVGKKQNWKCSACQLSLLSDDKFELHHKDGNNENNKYSNLEILHRFCHMQKTNHGVKKAEGTSSHSPGAVCGESRKHGFEREVIFSNKDIDSN